MAYKLRNLILLLTCFIITAADSELNYSIKERYNPVALIAVGGRVIKQKSYLDLAPLKVKFKQNIDSVTPIIVGHNRLTHFYKLPTSSTLLMERKNQPNIATYYPFGQIEFSPHIVEGERLIVFLQPKTSQKYLWKSAIVAKILKLPHKPKNTKVSIVSLCKNTLFFQNRELGPRVHKQFKVINKNTLYSVKQIAKDLAPEEEILQFQLSPSEQTQQIVVFYDVLPEANRGKSISYFLLNIPLRQTQPSSETTD